jgi:diacylglycerol kinase family enzyme
MANLYLLINPHAGGGRAARLAPVLTDWTRAQGSERMPCVADNVPQALAWLRSLPHGATVALVGGDGTVNQLLPALLDQQLRLALIPQGSGNDVARALGVFGMSWQQALQWAQNKPPQAMDVGWLHTSDLKRPFLSSLTVGFDSAVGFKALQGPRWLRGLPRYVFATLREIFALQTWNMQVAVDGKPLHHGCTLFASTLNTSTYGSGMPAVPHARIDDGMLDLLVAGEFNAWQTLFMLPRLLAARHLSHPRVQTVAFKRLDIACAQALPLAADGEYLGEARTLTVQVAASALQVMRR